MNVLKTMGGILRNKYLDHKVPIAVTMAVTFRCTLRCKYCRIWKKAGEEMSTGQVMATIDELAEAGTCRLGITGGEPLLRHDIGSIVARAKERDLFTTIFTNGTLVDQHLDTLRRADTVLVSLDGPREIHDKMRGRGSHAAAIKAVEMMTSAGIKVWTNTVVTHNNTHVVDHILELARRYDTHAVFQPIFEHSYTIKGKEVDALAASRDDYTGLVDRLMERKRAGDPVLNSLSSLKLLRSPESIRGRTTCLASRAYCAVTPDGKVAPCQVLLQMEGLPDGKKIGFMEAFKRARKPDTCTSCSCFATIEGDMLFSLDPPTVVNTVGYMTREKMRRLGRLIASDNSGGSRASRDHCDGAGPCSCEATADPSSAEPVKAQEAEPATAEDDNDLASISKA